MAPEGFSRVRGLQSPTVMREGNWIDGAWRRASRGDAFEAGLRPAPRGRDLWWPRSEVEDLIQALEALRAPTIAWRRQSSTARARALGDLLDDWQREGSGVDLVAELIGLEAGGLDLDLEEALLCGDEALAAAGSCGLEADDRPRVVRVLAGESLRGFVGQAFPALLRGQPLLVLSDPELPWMAREFVSRLTRDERLAGVVALLHDDRSTCWSAALGSGAISGAYAPGVDASGISGESLVLGQAPSVESRARPFGDGLGIESSREPAHARALVDEHLELAPIRNASYVVLEDDDPVEAASAVYQAAFGKWRAFSGQRAGQVGRVLCHQRLFSAFGEALLESIEAGAAELPCRLFSTGLERYWTDLCRLGLDEGATLVCGGPEEGLGFRAGRQKGILAPSVFTNAEPTMGVARAQRPVPVLSLMRVTSDAEARALALGFR